MPNLDSLNTAGQLVTQPSGARLPEQPVVNGATSGNTLPPVAESSAQPSVEAPSAEQLEAVVAKLSDFTQSLQRDLAFSVDDNTGKTVITVTDRETEEIVRQIPSEELIQLAQNLRDLQEKLESTKGNLLEARV